VSGAPRGFEFAHRTRLVFGAGVWTRALAETRALGRKVLLVTGESSFSVLGLEPPLLDAAARSELEFSRFSVSHEPDIETADRAAVLARTKGVSAVLAIGGGSALDVAKAAAALATNQGSARAYLEGMPTPPAAFEKAPLPLVCVPTTAGTGSEVTKNAVIQVADLAVKRSMRSELLFPLAAFIDPELSARAPKHVRAGTGFDALTHLSEAFCSKNASPITDALARDAIPRAVNALRALAAGSDESAEAADLAYASTLGGICLANAGLGAAHGLIAPLGGLYPHIPHGAGLACLLPTTLLVNAEAARADAIANARLEELAHLLAGATADIESAAEHLLELRRALALPALASYASIDVARVITSPSGSLKTNPITLSQSQLSEILQRALND